MLADQTRDGLGLGKTWLTYLMCNQRYEGMDDYGASRLVVRSDYAGAGQLEANAIDASY